jgi:methyl-accepting chemotaxis protein
MHDEIGDMYRALINLRDNFKSIIESIQNTSSIVHKNTEDLAAISVENSSSMEEIGKACEDIANKLLDFSASNQHGLDQLKKLTEAIIHADTVIKNNIVAGIDNSNQIGTDGIHNINVLTQKSNEIENLRQHIAIQIAGIGTETSKLENITSLIEEVSSQINLLSINALIQAAHISENNGFAVIAQEIRKLSERTAEENKNIQTFIRQVGQKVNQLLTDSNSFTSEFNEYNQIITQTEKLFNNLKKSIEMVSTGLSSLVEQSKIINDQQSSVTKIITKNCELSTEFSSTVEEISASVQQYNAASQENLDDINKLEEKAEDLKKSTTIFKINEDKG